MRLDGIRRHYASYPEVFVEDEILSTEVEPYFRYANSCGAHNPASQPGYTFSDVLHTSDTTMNMYANFGAYVEDVSHVGSQAIANETSQLVLVDRVGLSRFV